jgi:glycosyltransferase involved in cell wall biosynthesis
MAAREAQPQATTTLKQGSGPLGASIRTLYLCYFGLREPLVQTQVLPYLRQLGGGGIDVSLLTFEPDLNERWRDAELAAERARLAAQGIRWHCLAYHKRPSIPATVYDILAGARLAARLIRREGVSVLHARSHVPMAMALLAARTARCRIVFDFRGLMADEYADAGIWTKNSLPFRAVKRLERAGLRRADQVVVLTRRMRDWLRAQNLVAADKIEVIPCCVDFARYDAPQAADDSARTTDDTTHAAQRFEVVYAGAVTGLYLLEEMGRFFLAVRARRPNALFRILTMGAADKTAAVLKRVGLEENDFWIGAARAAEVPVYLRRAQLGLSFRKSEFSQIAASPTKIPEYLAAGLPVVSNAGIGDMDELIEREQVGVVLRAFTPEAYDTAVARALALTAEPDGRRRRAEVARRYFDLARVGGAGYVNVYRRLTARALATEAEVCKQA